MSQPMSEQQLKAAGPPYPPRTAGVGGVPSTIPDIPILAVFMAFYLTFAITNFSLFRHNRGKGHLFVPSAMMGGFSMARIVTCSLRIAWARNQMNVSLAIAATIFVNAGILIVYIINILFAQRILRAKQPQLGWSRIVKGFFITLYVLIGVALVLVIVLNVMSFFTLNEATLTDAKWILRGAILYLLIVTIMPLVLLALAFGLPRSENEETYGKGSIVSKAIVLSIGACICVTIAGFKTGVNWSPPRPITDPAWYDSKAAFYVFNFTLEIIILTLYTTSRVDKRHHVPNGSSKRRSYAVHESSKVSDSVDGDLEKKQDSNPDETEASDVNR